MDRTNFGAVSFQVAAAAGGPAAEPPSPLGPFAGLGGAPPESRTTRGLLAAIFVASLVLHVLVLLRFQGNHPPRLVNRKPSQVEIQFTRPPTPVVVPPQAAIPTPAKVKPAASPRPQPRLALPEPVHAAPTAVADEPGIDAPVGDQGTAPPGVGDVAGPVVEAPAPPPPPPPAPVIAAKEGANYMKNPRPGYPRLALREGWEGTVLLRVRVLPSGRPEGVTVQKSSGHTSLDEAAVEAVKGWAFSPATQGGEPVAGWVNVPIEFHLQ